MFKVGQNRIYTPYMTVNLVISLPKIPYINRIHWFWPTLLMFAPIFGMANSYILVLANSYILVLANSYILVMANPTHVCTQV